MNEPRERRLHVGLLIGLPRAIRFNAWGRGEGNARPLVDWYFLMALAGADSDRPGTRRVARQAIRLIRVVVYLLIVPAPAVQTTSS
jgi:hypothetical protein